MVYRMPCPVRHMLFVASSHKDGFQAEMEIAQWAQANGYRLPEDGQAFVIYRDGEEAREWRMLERFRPA